ncbi:MAG: hypothetical protein KDB00_10525 [Planctomycetales bacterium]|nr:hypothetical protein [Planctomycetales bacterium]
MSFAIAVLACSPLAIDTADAQQPATQAVAHPTTTTQPGWNLRWRQSPKVTPQPVHVPQDDVFSRPARKSLPATLAKSTAANAALMNTSAASNGVAQVAPNQFGHNQVGHQPDRTAAPMIASPDNPMRSEQANAMRSEQANAFRHAVVSRSIRQAAAAQQQPAVPQDLGIQQVQFSDPDSAAPIGNYRRTQRSTQIVPASGPTRMAQANDFFNNPFADQTAPPAINQQSGSSTHLTLSPSPQTADDSQAGGFQLPATDGPASDLPSNALPSNALRGTLQGGAESIPPGQAEGIGLPGETIETLPEPKATAPEPALPTPESGPSMRDLLNDQREQIESNAQPDLNDPSTTRGDEQTESPSDQEGIDMPYQNPFDENREQRGQGGPDAQSARQPAAGAMGSYVAKQLSCEEFRERIARETIDKISLDPSPPFGPHLFDPDLYREKREQFNRRQQVRPWSGIDGRVMANGRLIELAYEQVVIENENGQRQEVPVNRLSEGDLGYLSEHWGLPKECLIEQVAYTPRSWTPLTMTWKASNICSKPRYFEEVNLERYGHTAGPWLQPVVSSAHFFANIAVLPYKMGIHPPGECQYALGYYRPGNCAPWVLPPVPISARGALTQGAAMTGAFWLIP